MKVSFMFSDQHHTLKLIRGRGVRLSRTATPDVIEATARACAQATTDTYSAGWDFVGALCNGLETGPMWWEDRYPSIDRLAREAVIRLARGPSKDREAVLALRTEVTEETLRVLHRHGHLTRVSLPNGYRWAITTANLAGLKAAARLLADVDG